MAETITRMPLAVAFEVAMVDAVNIYIRTVLLAGGYITREGFDAHGGEECLQAKYAIVRQLAAEWANFDGYEKQASAPQKLAEATTVLIDEA